MLCRFTSLLLVVLLAAFANGQLNTGTGINTGGGNLGGGLQGGGGQGIAGFGGLGQQAGAGGGAGGATESISGFFNDNSDIQGTGFLGRSANQNGFLLGDGGGGANNQFGNAGGFGGFGGQGGGAGAGNRGGQQPQRQQSTRVIRTKISIPRDFGRVVIPQSRIRSRLNLEYQRVSQLQRTRSVQSQSQPQPQSQSQSRITTGGLRGSSITATPSGESVILSGSVASERDRIIAEKMAKMEPGVRSVINQLTVSPQIPQQ